MSASATRPLLRAFGAMALAFVLTSPASADPVASTMPENASRCLSCHGATGRPVLPHVPIIAGQQPGYLLSALHAYRDGGRITTNALVMQNVIKDLGNDDLAELANWFGAQK